MQKTTSGNKVEIIKIERGNVMIRQAMKEDYRRKGYARALVAECEKWTRQMGCSEFASDCELNNDASLAFHRNMGFTEAGRIICFTKPI